MRWCPATASRAAERCNAERKRGATLMVRLWHIAAWPLVVKVPVLVAGLMVTVAVTTSQVVLWRFAQDQKSNLGLLTDAYLDGLSAAVLPRPCPRESARSCLMPSTARDATDMPASNRALQSSSCRTGRSLLRPIHAASRCRVRCRTSCAEGSQQATVSISTPTSDSAWLARTLRTEGGPCGTSVRRGGHRRLIAGSPRNPD